MIDFDICYFWPLSGDCSVLRWMMVMVVLVLLATTSAVLPQVPETISSSIAFERASELNEKGNRLRVLGDAAGAIEMYLEASNVLPQSMDIRKNLLSIWLTLVRKAHFVRYYLHF
jgi:hypothetical protein